MRKSRKMENPAPSAGESELLALAIVEGLQEKKAKEIVSLNLKELKSAVADYFIVCHGESRTQVEALARSVEETVYKLRGEDPWHTEGLGNAEWILMDYVSVVVHIFNKEKREFYGVERLWADAEIRQYED